MTTPRPQAARARITEQELLRLAASIVDGEKKLEIDRAVIIAGTSDGGVGLVGSGLVKTAPMMVLLLAAALERVAVQELSDRNPELAP